MCSDLARTCQPDAAFERPRGRRPRLLGAALCSLLLALALGTSPARAATLLGSAVVQPDADSNAAGTAEAFASSASASGSVSQLSLYLSAKNKAKRVAVGLFSDAAGHPGSLLTQASIDAPVKSAWNTVDVSPVAVVAGQTYWLAVLSPKGSGLLGFRDKLGGGSAESSASTTLTALPATWVPGAAHPDGPISMVASSPASPTPILAVSPTQISFTATVGGANPAPAALSIANTGGGTLAFTAAASPAWLGVAPASGSAPATGSVSASSAGLAVGSYSGQVTITAPGAANSPAVVPVSLTVRPVVNVSGDWPMVGQGPTRGSFAANDASIDKTNVASLGLKWSAVLDGKVSAQPLFLSGVTLNGVAHDLVIAASNQNSLYAFDADSGALQWSVNLGANMGGSAYAVPGGFGIRSAPVVERATNRIFVVSDDGKLHTRALATGAQVVPPLQLIDLPVTNKVRGGLNLLGNKLYAASGSDGGDSTPWRGRIFGLDVSGAGPVLLNTFDVVPSVAGNHRGGGVWGYGGVSVDPATGHVYAATGADYRGAFTPYAVRMLKLTPELSLVGSYEPPHPDVYDCDGSPCDLDFGATPTVFTPAGCPTMVASGNKDGHLYVMRTTDFSANSVVYQALTINTAFDGLKHGGLGGVPAFWPAGNMLFVTDSGDGKAGIAAGVVALSISPAPACQLAVAWSQPLPKLASTQSSPTVVGDVVMVGEGGSGVVHAYDALTGAELWNSGSTVIGGTFAAPTVGAGKVFVGSWAGSAPQDYGVLRAFAPGAGGGDCTGAPPAVLAGTQTITSGLDSNVRGQAEAFQVTALGCGSVASLNLYLDASSTARKVVVGLYADNAGHPGTLLTQASTSAPVAGAWNRIVVPPATVTVGVPYWFAVLGTGTGTVAFRDAAGGCRAEASGVAGLTALAPTWTRGAEYTSCPLSGYAAP